MAAEMRSFYPWQIGNGSWKTWRRLDDIREYDEAKGRLSEPVAFEQAVREIRQGTGP